MALYSEILVDSISTPKIFSGDDTLTVSYFFSYALQSSVGLNVNKQAIYSGLSVAITAIKKYKLKNIFIKWNSIWAFVAGEVQNRIALQPDFFVKQAQFVSGVTFSDETINTISSVTTATTNFNNLLNKMNPNFFSNIYNSPAFHQIVDQDILFFNSQKNQFISTGLLITPINSPHFLDFDVTHIHTMAIAKYLPTATLALPVRYNIEIRAKYDLI